jgi:RNA polymerase sigma-70 factor (ECF subfamily)
MPISLTGSMQGFRPVRYQPAGTGPGGGLTGERGPDLLSRARSGDREALDQLCREHWLPVYRAVCRWAQSPAEAEDLTQDVFIRAIRALGNYRDDEASYRAYLLRIARNLVIDRWRARPASTAGYQDLPDLADPAAGPEAAAITRDEHSRLLAALDRLPDPYSDVLRLRILGDRTAAEVGEIRGQSANAIRQLQFRAIAALRRELAAGTAETGENQ